MNSKSDISNKLCTYFILVIKIYLIIWNSSDQIFIGTQQDVMVLRSAGRYIKKNDWSVQMLGNISTWKNPHEGVLGSNQLIHLFVWGELHKEASPEKKRKK